MAHIQLHSLIFDSTKDMGQFSRSIDQRSQPGSLMNILDIMPWTQSYIKISFIHHNLTEMCFPCHVLSVKTV